MFLYQQMKQIVFLKHLLHLLNLLKKYP